MILIRCIFSSLLLTALTAISFGDEFELSDGRTITGSLRREIPVSETVKQFVVDVRPGVTVLLNSDQIKQHTRTVKDAQDAYAEEMKKYQDTVEFHLMMAGKCTRWNLNVNKLAHYERVLNLDPNNGAARAALGYTKGKDGRWVKLDAEMTEGRGKVRDGKRYVFAEVMDIPAIQAADKTELSNLHREVSRWQQDVMDQNRRATESLEKLKSFQGRHASSVIRELLFPKSSPGMRKVPAPAPMRLIYVSVLARLKDPIAIRTLIDLSLKEGSMPDAQSLPEVSNAVLQSTIETLRNIAPEAASYAYLAVLASDNIAELNHAARLLQEMKQPSTVLPLIERLVSVHRQKRQAPPPNYNMNQGTMTMGNPKPVIEEIRSENQDVRTALRELTGKDFGFNKAEWMDWYNQTHFPPVADLRRDP